MRTVWWVGSVTGFGLLGLLVGLAVAIVAGGDGGLGTALVRVAVGGLVGLVIGAASAWVVVPRRFASWRYRFGAEALELERGIWWRTSSAVPYQRIQQVEIEHGPIERRLDIVGLALRTAAASSLGSLPGIAEAEAAALRVWLLHRAGADDGA